MISYTCKSMNVQIKFGTCDALPALLTPLIPVSFQNMLDVVFTRPQTPKIRIYFTYFKLGTKLLYTYNLIWSKCYEKYRHHVYCFFKLGINLVHHIEPDCLLNPSQKTQ